LPRHRGTHVPLRQVQRERAARARCAPHMDLTAEQARELPADRQAEAGSAVLAARAGVGLLERLEYDSLLLRRDADPGIGDLGRNDTRGPSERRGGSET